MTKLIIPLADLVAGHTKHRLSKLTRNVALPDGRVVVLRAVVAAYIPDWDILTPVQRSEAVARIDQQRRTKARIRVERLLRVQESEPYQAEVARISADFHKNMRRGGAAVPATKRLHDYVKDAVDRICAHKQPDGTYIDRQQMPGTAGDLLWLMEMLHPEKFADMQIKAFREHYKVVCKWSRAASCQPGARSRYLEIFPELKTIQDTVKNVGN